MSREPQTLVWLPTLHRLIATETSKYIYLLFFFRTFFFQFVMKLNVIHVKRIPSSACGKKNTLIYKAKQKICLNRYRCLRCFNYDLCQTCFFTGDHAKNHDGTHPIEEYCKQVKDFF
jgi:hypothetical protein